MGLLWALTLKLVEGRRIPKKGGKGQRPVPASGEKSPVANLLESSNRRYKNASGVCPTKKEIMEGDSWQDEKNQTTEGYGAKEGRTGKKEETQRGQTERVFYPVLKIGDSKRNHRNQ